MNDTGPVDYKLNGSIATIAMDDDKANVMSEAMLIALDRALDRAERDRAVVLLVGRPRCFSGGYDLAMFQRGQEEVARTLRRGAELVIRMLGFPLPIVLACTGHAVAQGAFTLLAGDVRIGATGDYKIGLNEVAIGLVPPHYGVEIARFRLTPAGFNHALTTGTLYRPEQAQEIGFLDRVVSAESLLEVAHEEAKQLCGIDMNAHAGTKERVRADVLCRMREGIAKELADA